MPEPTHERASSPWSTGRWDGATEWPRHLVLCRHGETDWNAESRWQGQTDVPLNAAGRAQAEMLAGRLSGETFDRLWTSDLSRARVTAEVVGRAVGLTPEVTPLLREISVGEWEGLTGAEIRERFPEGLGALARGEDVAAGGGESSRQFHDRVRQGIALVARSCPGGSVLVVVHGGVIKVAVAQLLGVPAENVGRISAGRNAAVTEFHFDRAGPRLVRLHDAAHVERAAT